MTEERGHRIPAAQRGAVEFNKPAGDAMVLALEVVDELCHLGLAHTRGPEQKNRTIRSQADTGDLLDRPVECRIACFDA